jgi:uncharacterized protein (TIGR02466 family)
MSSLSKLANTLTPKKVTNKWPSFYQAYPLKVKDIADPTNGGVLNSLLEKGIRDAGDKYENRTEAKCLMTRWDMHDHYESFNLIGQAAISLAQSVPLAKRTTPEGQPETVPLIINESWGLIYNKGQFCNSHTHWPSLWSYTYCVKGDDCCPPLIFPDMQQTVALSNGMDKGIIPDENLAITPKTGQLILWPAWLQHYVSIQECDCDRIMIAGNLDRGDL